MRKVIVALLLVVLIVLGTQAAFAMEAGIGGRGNYCFLELLPEEVRRQAEDILGEFHIQINTIRERIASHRGSAGRESRSEAREEIWDLKRAVREAIAPLLPEEHRESFMDREYGRRRHFQPADRPARGGWKTGNSEG